MPLTTTTSTITTGTTTPSCRIDAGWLDNSVVVEHATYAPYVIGDIRDDKISALEEKLGVIEKKLEKIEQMLETVELRASIDSDELDEYLKQFHVNE